MSYSLFCWSESWNIMFTDVKDVDITFFSLHLFLDFTGDKWWMHNLNKGIELQDTPKFGCSPQLRFKSRISRNAEQKK